MKKIFVLLTLTVSFFYLSAQTKPGRAPLNPDFIEYMELKKSGELKKSTSAEGYSLGYNPSPLYINFNKRGVESETRKSTQALPSYYNLKDFGWVSTVKNQGPVGACMSFATMGAIESRWLKLGFGNVVTQDLSEQNMATCHGFEWGIDDGGNLDMTTAYLSRLSGPVTELSNPYTPTSGTCKKFGLIRPAYSPISVYLPKDIQIVKKAIFDYGAVSAGIYAGAYLNYFNRNDNTYLYNGTSPVDHAVLVVGWDDNLIVTGKEYQPVNKGAWIVKNSWGSDWGDNGYLYVSYEDSRFLSASSYYPERLEISDIDTLIMYDWLGTISSFGLGEETLSGLAKFESSNNLFINKIGTSVVSSGSFIDIEIYKEFTGDSVLSEMVASSHNNFCKFPGYYTFDIPALVNGNFFVKVKYYTPGYNYPIPVEFELPLGGEPYALPEIEKSGIFWISADEKEWKPFGADLEDKDFQNDISIRVYAERNTNLNAFFTADKLASCVNSDIIFKSSSNGSITNYAWDFGAGAIPATANTAGPHTVKYSTAGLKDISLTITGPAGTDILKKNSYVEAVTDLDIFLPYSEKRLINGKSFTLTANGADTYSWSPSTGLNTTTGAMVVASPSDTTKYTVTGTMGACSGQASITLNVVNGPPNDDVCNAIEITTGNRGFNNIYATVEDGEPAPPEGDCNTALEWCVEGGLQNSVWFWLTAPASGNISLTTEGMDTQIAVYKADHCDSILLGGYEMIAANDDYFPESKFFAAALSMVSVIPGQKYFIQIDGSAGGDEGEFRLIYWESPVSVNDIINTDKLNIYPNPNSGTFILSYNSGTTENHRIRVLNSSGQEIYLENIKNFPKNSEYEISLGKTSPGVYIFELTSGKEVLHKNFLIK